MTTESIFFNSFRHGKAPKIQHISRSEISDSTIPLRLMLGSLLGCCGNRMLSSEKMGGGENDIYWTWYWQRGVGDWWYIPNKIHEKIKDGINQNKNWLALEIVESLEALDFPVSVYDKRISQILMGFSEGSTIFPNKLRDRVNSLLERHKKASESDKMLLNWLIIEMVLNA